MKIKKLEGKHREIIITKTWEKIFYNIQKADSELCVTVTSLVKKISVLDKSLPLK